MVSSDLFGRELPKGRILVVQDCHVLPAPVVNPHMVLARVAGYDKATLGLPKEVTPILFELPGRDVLVATTKLSHFVSGRYAPTKAWAAVWRNPRLASASADDSGVEVDSHGSAPFWP